ncbi:hypothetical protein BT69DRAFT_1279776 [Atractiella rhizophila]|nr:hypothetical protein BT69DRAFT_1279776 [Atractiella rhizophila]
MSNRRDPMLRTFTEHATFGPTEYIPVVAPNGLEVLPDTENADVWLSCQVCPCGRFATAGKRPIVIKNHFATCRANYGTPLQLLSSWLMRR